MLRARATVVLHRAIATKPLTVPKCVLPALAVTLCAPIRGLLLEPVVRPFLPHATANLFQPTEARYLMMIEVGHVGLDVE